SLVEQFEKFPLGNMRQPLAAGGKRPGFYLRDDSGIGCRRSCRLEPAPMPGQCSRELFAVGLRIAARCEGAPCLAAQYGCHVIQRLQYLEEFRLVDPCAAVAHRDKLEPVAKMEGQHDRTATAKLPIGLGALISSVFFVANPN